MHSAASSSRARRRAAATALIVMLGVGAACSSSSSSESGEPLPVPGVGPDSTAGATATTGPATSTEPVGETTPSVSVADPLDGDGGASTDTTVAPSSSAAVPTEAPTSPPETAPPTTSTPTGGIAVMYGGGRTGSPWTPLGWWDGTGWRDGVYAIDGTWIGPPAPTIEGLSATSLDLPDGAGQVVSSVTAGPADFFCVRDETGPTIDLGVALPETPLTMGYDAVAVTADWPIQPRPVRQIGAEVPIYAEVGAALMADLVDTAADGEVVQVVRVDLDADGDEEVLVAYERQLMPQLGGAGDFTSVYVRVPTADGSVDEQLVTHFVGEDPDEMEFPFPTPGRMTVAAVADLNGDGVMEVAVRELFWEYGGISIYAFVDGRLERVVSGGCGV